MTCMHDRNEQCFGDCPNCPRANSFEPDPDDLRDEMLDREADE